MKTKILILLSLATFLFACNDTKTAHNEESGQDEHDHENHAPKGTVQLNEKQQEALNLKLGHFEMRNLTTVIKTNGQLEVPPSSSADVTTIFGGNIRKIRVFSGDKVRKGQVLAILENPEFITIQENYSEVLNKLDYLKQDYERQKQLFENNAGAGKDYQKAKSEYKIAKSKLAAIKSRLSLLNISTERVKEGKISNSIAIVSPLNGYVTEVNVKLGTYVDSKDKLFEIRDISEIHADFMVYEKDVNLIEIGQKIHFNISNRPEDEFLATIFAVGKEFDDKTRSIHIHAKIDKKSKRLIPGMYVTGHIHTDKRMTKTLPDDAIVTEGTKSFVFALIDEHEEEHIHIEEEHNHEGEEHEHDENELHEERHDHDKEEHHNDEDRHAKTFKMIEIIKGQQDDGYTEIKLIKELPEDTKFVLNAAYYLLADMNKEETEHNH